MRHLVTNGYGWVEQLPNNKKTPMQTSPITNPPNYKPPPQMLRKAPQGVWFVCPNTQPLPLSPPLSPVLQGGFPVPGSDSGRAGQPDAPRRGMAAPSGRAGAGSPSGRVRQWVWPQFAPQPSSAVPVPGGCAGPGRGVAVLGASAYLFGGSRDTALHSDLVQFALAARRCGPVPVQPGHATPLKRCAPLKEPG